MAIIKEKVQDFLDNLTNTNVVNIIPVLGGEWSQAYFFEVGGKSKVIRFSQTDEDFRKDDFAHNFNSAKLPIPAVEMIGEVFGGYYAISPKIEGVMIDKLPQAEIIEFVPHVLDLFNTLRMIDISGTSGYGGWKANGTAPFSSWQKTLSSANQFDKASRVDWRAGLSARPEAAKIFQNTYNKMTTLLKFCPEDRHLIHNDLLHYNLLVNGGQVAGVIDWGCSLYGDFLFDLALFDFWQFYYPSMKGIDWKGEAKIYFENLGVDMTNFEERLKCYQCHLALEAIKYTVFKNHEKDLALTIERIKEIIE